MTDDSVPIVIDNGSGRIKFGFAGQDASEFCWFPTMVTVAASPPNSPPVDVGDTTGNERRGNRVLKYPIDRGVIVHWEYMEFIWKRMFMDHLRVPPESHPVLWIETPMNPKANRERTAQILLETLGVPAVYSSTQSVLSLYASGRTTGCVLDSGHGVTHAVPICEGHMLPHAVIRMDLAGKDLTDYMVHILRERELDPSRYAQTEIACDIKESLCFVSLDFDQDMEKAANSDILEASFELPSGEIITLGNERFRCPEALFRPEFMGLEDMGGIAQITLDAIDKCNRDIRSDLFRNILLTGGCTLFPGICERMSNEMSSLASDDSLKINVSACKTPLHSAVIGGSIVASLPEFQSMWITKTEFNENSSVVHEDRL